MSSNIRTSKLLLLDPSAMPSITQLYKTLDKCQKCKCISYLDKNIRTSTAMHFKDILNIIGENLTNLYFFIHSFSLIVFSWSASGWIWSLSWEEKVGCQSITWHRVLYIHLQVHIPDWDWEYSHTDMGKHAILPFLFIHFKFCMKGKQI